MTCFKLSSSMDFLYFLELIREISVWLLTLVLPPPTSPAPQKLAYIWQLTLTVEKNMFWSVNLCIILICMSSSARKRSKGNLMLILFFSKLLFNMSSFSCLWLNQWNMQLCTKFLVGITNSAFNNPSVCRLTAYEKACCWMLGVKHDSWRFFFLFWKGLENAQNACKTSLCLCIFSPE